MASESSDRSGQDEQAQIAEFGRGPSPAGRWLTRLALAALVAAAAVAVALHAGGHSRRAAGTAPPPPPPVRIISVGHQLLGVTAGWELFARGDDDLVRVQLGQGRITETYVPPLETGNPDVSFLIGARDVVIRSSDLAAGYVVPDGKQARILTGALAGSGPLIPGPQPEQAAWVTSGSPASPALSLVTIAGKRSGRMINFPAGTAQVPATAVSDGRGYALVSSGSFQTYDAGPSWNTPVPGTVAAVGPADWLVLACNAEYRHCRNEVVSSATGARRVLPGPALPDAYFFRWPPDGVISPDGRTAAVPEANRAGQLSVHLIDLRSGSSRAVDVALGPAGNSTLLGVDANDESMAWSPDSRWLFVAAAGGRLVVVNAQSGRVEGLGVALPAVTQVAIRAQSGAGS